MCRCFCLIKTTPNLAHFTKCNNYLGDKIQIFCIKFFGDKIQIFCIKFVSL